MDKDLTLLWCNEVIGSFSFHRRLLAWDTYECHLMDQVFVFGGATRYIQTADVSWNKPFKGHCQDSYDNWLDTEGLLQETEAGNLKAPPRKRIVEWVLTSRGNLMEHMIQESFVTCGLTNSMDGSQDDEIHFLKAVQPCMKGRALMKEHLLLLNSEEENPFVTDEEDIAHCCPENTIVESDHKCDDEIEID